MMKMTEKDLKDKQEIIRRDVLCWLRKYDESQNLSEIRNQSDGVLQGEALDAFVDALQQKIVESVNLHAGGFGTNSVGENAELQLYSGVWYEDVKKMCEQSHGTRYMISQTAADILWDRELRKTIAKIIGEEKDTDPISSRVLAGKCGEEETVDGKQYRLLQFAQYATDSHRYLALDDFISQKVVEAGLAKGRVFYILKNDNAGIPRSVGLLTEIPHVLNLMWSQGIDAEKTSSWKQA